MHKCNLGAPSLVVLMGSVHQNLKKWYLVNEYVPPHAQGCVLGGVSAWEGARSISFSLLSHQDPLHHASYDCSPAKKGGS